MREWIRYAKKICMRVILFPLRIMPIKQNCILLVNDLSYNYSDSPKYIAESLLAAYPNRFFLAFAIKKGTDAEAFRDRGMKTVAFNSPAYFYYAMRAAVFVTNNGGYSYLPLRKKQLVINTWHGAAYKRDGLASLDSKIFRRDLALSAKPLDYFLVGNHASAIAMASSHAIPEEKFWEIGMPRNDILLRNEPQLRQRIREKLGIRSTEKLVLFAPTFRRLNGEYLARQVAIDYRLDHVAVCEALQERFGGVWRMGVRLHPRVKPDTINGENALNLSDYEDMQELLLAADVLITDFSSSMWDFSLTGKPCFLYAPDLYEYLNTTGVYIPAEQWPFSKASSNDELIHNILAFDEVKYADDVKRHHEILGICETGEAGEKVLELICRTYSGEEV